jgi:hypothetical protein
MPDQLERRGDVRLPLLRSARCHDARGQTIQGQLLDLSASGCRMLATRNPFAVDAAVSVRLVGLEGIAARIQWAEGGAIGIKFERPLYQPVVEYLAGPPSIP